MHTVLTVVIMCAAGSDWELNLTMIYVNDVKKQRINIVSIVMAAFTRYFTVSAIRKAIVLRSGSTIQHEYLMSLYPTASVAELSSAQLYSFAWR